MTVTGAGRLRQESEKCALDKELSGTPRDAPAFT